MSRRIAAAAAAALLLAGCATTGGTAAERDPRDPLEGVNRAVFSFNEAVDAALLKPVASAWRAVLPAPVREGIENVFANVGDLWSAFNQLLQAKPKAALDMTLRVGVNTLFGVGGLFDPATPMGLERQSEDFGQTLGRWGIGPGPYTVLPILGPSTLRDSLAMPVDMLASPPDLFHEPRDRNGATVLQVISRRAALLDASRVIDDVALDKYLLVRDGYLARRLNQVYDGDPPEEPGAPK